MNTKIGEITHNAQEVITKARYRPSRLPTWHDPASNGSKIAEDLSGIEGRVINLMPGQDFLAIARLAFQAGASSYVADDNLVSRSQDNTDWYNSLTEARAREKLRTSQLKDDLHLVNEDPLIFLDSQQRPGNIIISSLDERLFHSNLVNTPQIQAYFVELARQIEVVSKGYRLFGDIPPELARHISREFTRTSKPTPSPSSCVMETQPPSTVHVLYS